MVRQLHLMTWAGWWSGMLVGSAAVGGGAAIAQIIPDTAGDRSTGTVVLPTAPTVEIIQGGNRPQNGINLFHSFQEFNVGVDRSVLFQNPVGVENIFSRVTGGNPSDISGTLGVLGSANLFLINPNGILFGPRSSLNLAGSFTATTASGVQFGDRGSFSATVPTPPAALLTVNPSAYFFSAVPTGNITVRSIQPVAGNLPPLGLPLDFSIEGLQVAPGQALTLLGGNVTVDGQREFAGLNAPGGRVEIGAVAGAGTIGLNPDRGLSFPDSVARADVNFIDAALVNTMLNTGGDLVVNARNIQVLNNSLLLTGILPNQGSAASRAGNLVLNATGEIRVDGLSAVGNLVSPLASGNGGDLRITAGSLTVAGGAQLSASTAGQGNAGNVVIQVRDLLLLQGRSADGSIVSAISSFVFPGIRIPVGNTRLFVSIPGAVGNGGQIAIATGSLDVLDGAVLNTSTLAQGNAGRLTVQASDRIRLDQGGLLLSTVEAGAAGQSGDIRLQARTVEVLNGAQVSTVMNGTGNAGEITVAAGDRLLLAQDGILSSAVAQGATGTAGNLVLTSPSIQLLNGSQVSTSSLGSGDGGDITLTGGSVVLDGTGSNAAPAAIASTVGVATGGRVVQIRIDDSNPQFPRPVIVLTPQSDQPVFSARGNSGNVNVTATTLFLNNNAQIDSRAFGQGNAGNIDIEVNGNLTAANNVQISTSGWGNHSSGNLSMTAAQITLENQSVGTVSSLGSGRAGTLTVASPFLTLNAGQLLAETATGEGGNIVLRVEDTLLLRNQSLISAVSAVAGETGRDGAIAISTRFILANASEDSDIVATGLGRTVGDNILVNVSGEIFGTQIRQQRTPESDIIAPGQRTLFNPEESTNTNNFDNANNTENILNPVADNAAQTQLDITLRLPESCIVRRNPLRNTFFITGTGGIPERPSDPPTPTFPTGTIRTVPEAAAAQPERGDRRNGEPHLWQPGDPIVEPQGVYRLLDGRLILSRECESREE